MVVVNITARTMVEKLCAVVSKALNSTVNLAWTRTNVLTEAASVNSCVLILRAPTSVDAKKDSVLQLIKTHALMLMNARSLCDVISSASIQKAPTSAHVKNDSLFRPTGDLVQVCF